MKTFSLKSNLTSLSLSEDDERINPPEYFSLMLQLLCSDEHVNPAGKRNSQLLYFLYSARTGRHSPLVYTNILASDPRVHTTHCMFSLAVLPTEGAIHSTFPVVLFNALTPKLTNAVTKGNVPDPNMGGPTDPYIFSELTLTSTDLGRFLFLCTDSVQFLVCQLNTGNINTVC